MYSIDRRRYFWVSASALLQGILLSEYVYAHSGLFLILPLTLVVIVPFALWLGQEHWGRRLKRFLWYLGALLAVFHAYWLWSALPEDSEIYYLPTQNMNLTRASAAVFLLLPFFQCRIASWSWRVPYSEIFFQLCRNVFLLFQAVIVTGIFWVLVLTASLLFDIIGLDFVPLIVFSPLVAFPLTSLTIALSITLALRHPGIDSLGRWILAILAWLLPPFSILSAVFVVSLPFSGLKTLWSTGQASSLMLLLQFSTILLANAAWLDGTRAAFPNKVINVIAKISLLCLPIYTALCLYSLGLRVQQYGWSADRVHAAFLVVTSGIWGLGYAGTALLRLWPSAMGRVNSAAVLIFVVIVVLMNSPVLDPYRLSANNQADRLLSGQAQPESFDFLYLRFSLGRYGSYALSRLRGTEEGSSGQAIQEKAAAALSVNAKEHWVNVRNGLIPEERRREILANSRVYPAGRVLSPQIVDGLARQWARPELLSLRGVRNSSELAFTFKKLRTGNEAEELLLIKADIGLVFDVSSPEPRLVGVIYGGASLSQLNLEDIKTAEPQFRDIDLNGRRYQVTPYP
jgi:hypothetical protein